MRAINTGSEPVTLSAMEQHVEKGLRIFDDPFAEKMLPTSMKFFVDLCRFPGFRSWIEASSEKAMPGGYAGILCRKQYIDQKLLSVRDRISAIVEIGAGYDSRSIRISSMCDLPYYELDFPKTMQSKQAIMRGLEGQASRQIHFIGMDLNSQKIGDNPQLQTVFSTCDKPLFIVMEAVTQYLSDEGIQEVFDSLENTPAGSFLAFTYVDKDFLDGKDMMRWDAAFKKYVKPGVWRFGLTKQSSGAFLDAHGWNLLEDVSTEETIRSELLNRRGLHSSAVERFVFAQKR